MQHHEVMREMVAARVGTLGADARRAGPRRRARRPRAARVALGILFVRAGRRLLGTAEVRA